MMTRRPSLAAQRLRRSQHADAIMAGVGQAAWRPRQAEPTLEDHGLPADFDVECFLAREKARNRTATSTRQAIAVAIGIFLGLSFLLDQKSLIGAIFTGGAAFGLVMWLSSYLPIDVGLALIGGDILNRRKVERLQRARAEWRYYNLTTGAGFWRELRGQHLENAAARLFRQQDWRVDTTAVTGDGGIDLVLRSSGAEIWCQCKGYSKPVSVTAIREIAGVCSASHASPMLIVVNGITRPALAEAEKYSVIVWDSEDLAAFARGELQPHTDRLQSRNSRPAVCSRQGMARAAANP